MNWHHRYAQLVMACTVLLIAAGGMVTSTGSGLSVPDWPTTYGQSMFSFPFSRMVGGIFYEHGHRLIATTVGFLTIGLVVFLFVVEKRRWMRRLGLIALAAVIVQGVLGGLTVKYFLPPPISIGHAGLAQIFFCLTISIALFTSRGWRAPAQPAVDDAQLRRRAKWLVGLVYIQILLGATMRHTGAGLAIPDFPLMFGQLVPPHWTLPIAIHFAHRAGALVVTIACLLMARDLWRRFGARPEFSRPAWILVCAVLTQVTLGASVVLSGKDPVINTLHVATGAIVLGTSVLIALRSHRVRFQTVIA